MPLSKITGNSFNASANTNIDNGLLFLNPVTNTIGINTTNPANGRIVITGSVVTTSQGIRLTGDTADARFICESATLGAGILGTFSDHSQLFYTNSTEKMRILSNGRVGIGVTTPSFLTEIVGGTDTAETTLLQIRSNFGGVNTATTLAFGNSTNPTAGSGRVELVAARDAVTASSFRIKTGDSDGNCTEKMRIDTIGSLRVGTTAAIVAQEKASINAGASAGYGLCVSTATPGGYSALLLRNNDGNSTSNQIFFQHQSTFVGSVTSTASTTAYNTSSDYRLKENIAPMTGALATVSLLKPVTYKWKVNGSNGQGFIAHELQAVVPDCVTGEKDAVDADGNIKAQGVDTSFLVATLTAAIQEQQAIIASLTSRIEALENQ
jgi:hypothetical protein